MNTRIKKLRNSLNLSQKEFGAKIGLKPTSMCDIENGRCNINQRVIISICAKFNVNEEWLKYGKGEMFNLNDKKFNEFFEIYKQLTKPLQDYLINCAKNLLEAQNKL